MKRLLLAVLLASLCAGLSARAETLRERYWRLHRERNATTRYGTPPRSTSNIPAGLKFLEYVENTGSQRVDTGILPTAGLVIRAEFTILQSDGQWVIGSYPWSDSQDLRIFKHATQSTLYHDRGNGRINGSTTLFSGGSTNHFVVECGNFYVMDLVTGQKKLTGTTRSDTFASTRRMVIFAEHASGTSINGVQNPTVARVNWCQFVTNNILVRDFVPAQDSNGVACFYDFVSGECFYSATSTPLVGGPEKSVSAAVSMAPEDIAAWLAPPPGSGEATDGDLWLDCLAIPEGNWLCECPTEGSTNTVWRAALCPSNILAAVVWRHAVGLAPTNLPVTLEHDPSRVIGRIERLFYEAGTGVVARISVTQSGYAWAVSNHCAKPSPDVRVMYATNCLVSTNGWIHEHQDYIDARCVPRGDDMTSVTNVPSGVRALVMAPVYLRGLSLVSVPLLPTYIEYRVPDHLRNAYPLRPPRQWTWRNGD